MILIFEKKNRSDWGPWKMLVWTPFEDMAGLKAFVQRRKLLPEGIKYGIFRADNQEKEKMLERFFGAPPEKAYFLFLYDFSDIPDPNAFTKAPTEGGDPCRPPLGIKGQNRPTGARDPLGFESLGDQALGVEFDPMFGSVGDGTVSDLVNENGAWKEIRRE